MNSIFLSNNKLTSANLKNTNNSNIANIWITGNPDLICIEVDNKAYSDANWTSKKDNTATYSENCTTASVNEFDAIDFSIYPNPVKGNLTINTTETLKKVIIYNLQGSKVLVANHKKINVNELPKGIYLIKAVTQTNKIVTKKFVKQ